MYFIILANAMAVMTKLKTYEPFQTRTFLQSQNTILLKYVYIVPALYEIKYRKSYELGKLCLNSTSFWNESVVSSNLYVKRKQVRIEKRRGFLQKRKKMLLCPKGGGRGVANEEDCIFAISFCKT